MLSLLAQLDPTVIGQVLVTLGAIAGTVWGWMELQRKKRAENRADIAEARTEAIVADANGTVYNLLVDRLKTLENEVSGLRSDLNKEREHSRSLEQKLARLDTWIRTQNLTPPSF